MSNAAGIHTVVQTIAIQNSFFAKVPPQQHSPQPQQLMLIANQKWPRHVWMKAVVLVWCVGLGQMERQLAWCKIQALANATKEIKCAALSINAARSNAMIPPIDARQTLARW
jgi:hypothetical protein